MRGGTTCRSDFLRTAGLLHCYVAIEAPPHRWKCWHVATVAAGEIGVPLQTSARVYLVFLPKMKPASSLNPSPFAGPTLEGIATSATRKSLYRRT